MTTSDEVNRQLALAHALEFARMSHAIPGSIVAIATTFLAFLNGDVDASSS